MKISSRDDDKESSFMVVFLMAQVWSQEYLRDQTRVDQTKDLVKKDSLPDFPSDEPYGAYLNAAEWQLCQFFKRDIFSNFTILMW